MNRRLFVVVLTLSSFSVHTQAQIGLINHTTTRQDSAFLFEAEENSLEVTGYNKANWQLSAQRASVSKTDSSLFVVIPHDHEPDTLTLTRNGKVVTKKIFYKIIVENPKARLGNITAESATISEVIATRRLIVYVPGYNNLDYRIFNFEMNLTADQIPDWQKITGIAGPALSPEAIALIRQLKPGNQITFQNVLIALRSCRLRTLPSFTLTIK